MHSPCLAVTILRHYNGNMAPTTELSSLLSSVFVLCFFSNLDQAPSNLQQSPLCSELQVKLYTVRSPTSLAVQHSKWISSKWKFASEPINLWSRGAWQHCEKTLRLKKSRIKQAHPLQSVHLHHHLASCRETRQSVKVLSWPFRDNSSLSLYQSNYK